MALHGVASSPNHGAHPGHVEKCRQNSQEIEVTSESFFADRCLYVEDCQICLRCQSYAVIDSLNRLINGLPNILIVYFTKFLKVFRIGGRESLRTL